MANQRDHLDEILDRIESHSQLIRNAANEPILTPEYDEVWWPYLVQRFGNEESMFSKIRIDRRIFGGICFGARQNDAVDDDERNEKAERCVKCRNIGLDKQFDGCYKAGNDDNVRRDAHLLGNEFSKK